MLIKIFIGVLLSWSTVVSAQNEKPNFNLKIQQSLDAHYNQYKDKEYFSGVSLSIYIPDQKIQNYHVGQLSHDKGSQKVSADTLFQIGSITKSFTAAIILQLEKEGKLNLDDTLKKWLPSYTKWSNVSLKQLLNMTSGLPNYSDAPLWNADEYRNPSRVWKTEELVDYVYPKKDFSPPLKPGYAYTNTSYILSSAIIEKITADAFEKVIADRVIKRANLTNTFYPIPHTEKNMLPRLAQGYGYNQYDNPELVGKKIETNLSWAGAAGAVIANSEDVVKWVKALFIDDKILNAEQKKKLMSLISVKTGKPIEKLTENDPRGFGLGVVKNLDQDKFLGSYWFYEGSTVGFRVLYVYFPCNGIIISAAFNSATNTENNHSAALIKKVYQTILAQFSKLKCVVNE